MDCRRGVHLLAFVPPTALALIAVCVLSPTQARAQSSSSDASADGSAVSKAASATVVTGTFELDPEASDDIDRVIAAGTEELGFVKSIARGRLKDTNPVYRTIEIDATADSVAVTFDGSISLVTATTGEPIDWKHNGETFEVSTRWDSGMLRQTFVAFDGTRENVSSLDPDGDTLRMDITVTSGMLPEPVEYVLVYRRKSP